MYAHMSLNSRLHILAPDKQINYSVIIRYIALEMSELAERLGIMLASVASVSVCARCGYVCFRNWLIAWRRSTEEFKLLVRQASARIQSKYKLYMRVSYCSELLIYDARFV